MILLRRHRLTHIHARRRHHRDNRTKQYIDLQFHTIIVFNHSLSNPTLIQLLYPPGHPIRISSNPHISASPLSFLNLSLSPLWHHPTRSRQPVIPPESPPTHLSLSPGYPSRISSNPPVSVTRLSLQDIHLSTCLCHPSYPSRISSNPPVSVTPLSFLI